MEETVSKLAERESTAFDLGKLLGQREAFSLVAGRCSAADAECIRKLRDEGAYKLKEEPGPAYFEGAQFTRISPEAYRTIAPAVTGNAIRWNGEAIELVAANAQR